MESVTGLYRPLQAERKEIHLLLLKGGHYDEPIQCEFPPAFLSEQTVPEYEAISYCWGDSTERMPIYLAGEERIVPASAYTVLQFLRYSEGDRVVWIDAVCIDQASNVDESQQVDIMDQVYARSKTCIIWLGPDEDDNAAKALTALTLVMGDIEKEIGDFTQFREHTLLGSAYVHSSTGLGSHINIRLPLDPSAEEHLILGECYVYGVLDGKIPDRIERTSFRIR